MKVTLFFKSWKEDLRWLHYALRFAAKNWQEPDTEVVVVLDSNCGELDMPPGADFPFPLKIYFEPAWPDGYSHAMFVKASADERSDGDLIMLIDSDTMIWEPMSLRDFMVVRAKPVIPYVFYSEHQKQYPFSPWKRVTENLMGFPTERHFMSRAPIMYWRHTFSQMRKFVERISDKSFFEATFSAEPFKPENFQTHPITICDYDALGLFAWHFQPHSYIFTHESEMPPKKARQFHSWTQWNEATEELLKTQLGEVKV